MVAVVNTIESLVRVHHVFLLVFRKVLESTCNRLSFRLNAHLLCTSLGESGLSSCLALLSFLFGDAVRVDIVLKFRPAGHLIVSIKRVTLAFRLRSLEKSAALCAEHVLGVQVCRSHLLAAPLDIGENAQALCRGLSTGNITGLKTSSKSFSVLGRLRQTSWHAAFNAPDIVALAVLVDDTVGWVKRVRATL